MEILAIEQRLLTLGNAIAVRYFLHGAPWPGGKNHGARVRYNVTHVTRYTYGATVELTTGVLRLKPVSRDGQILERFSLKTDPPCLPASERIDAFGNAVLSLRIEQPHRELTVEAASRVHRSCRSCWNYRRPGRPSPRRR